MIVNLFTWEVFDDNESYSATKLESMRQMSCLLVITHDEICWRPLCLKSPIIPKDGNTDWSVKRHICGENFIHLAPFEKYTFM